MDLHRRRWIRSLALGLTPAAAVLMALGSSAPALAAVATPVNVDKPYYERGIIFGDYHWCYASGVPAVVQLQMDKKEKTHRTVTGAFSCKNPTTGFLSYSCQSGKHSYRMVLSYACPGCNFLTYEYTDSYTKTC